MFFFVLKTTDDVIAISFEHVFEQNSINYFYILFFRKALFHNGALTYFDLNLPFFGFQNIKAKKRTRNILRTKFFVCIKNELNFTIFKWTIINYSVHKIRLFRMHLHFLGYRKSENKKTFYSKEEKQQKK